MTAEAGSSMFEMKKRVEESGFIESIEPCNSLELSTRSKPASTTKNS
eukprot:CAMPEP_0201249378 /NCGR_PEP_ID=MMETSP0852-20130820/59587_1 /ASSEMBLY_ACC=CAM_ASM_000632 /TAXON_ID=183588 /ORGANISM="Pseudo-nitzschia fraudulenta, Strain WWA7" /LENGTH=46 /DNA_ID= /DNA_START= /DNA_END= /DNA_ORIENTATION=